VGMKRLLGMALLTMLLATGLLTTCVTVEEPPCPPVTVTGGDGECSTSCQECPDPEGMKGRVFRINRLEIDEPAAFASLLNGIWESDIDSHTLNVLFFVTGAERNDEELAAFTRLEFVAGPAWRTPKLPLALYDEEGGPTATEQVESYCHLDGLDSSLDGEPYPGKLCEVRSTEDTSLLFHSGPKDTPLVCAPANYPANSIPIKNLKTRLTFNEDCTEIHKSFLEGCITIPDADHICMCVGGTGNCPYVNEDGPVFLETKEARAPYIWPYGWVEEVKTAEDPEEGGEGDVIEEVIETTKYTYKMFDEQGTPIENKNDILADYCATLCGATWMSFGQAVHMFSLNPTCQTPDGQPGYRLQGVFDAVTVTEKFNPVQSADCTKE